MGFRVQGAAVDGCEQLGQELKLCIAWSSRPVPARF